MPTEKMISVKSWSRAPLESKVHSYRVVRELKAVEVILDDQDQFGMLGRIRFTFASFGAMNMGYRQLVSAMNRSYAKSMIAPSGAIDLLDAWKKDPSCHVGKMNRVSR